MLLWHCCTWCSNETLLEMLIWGQWVFVLNSWVSWCFCDTVAPDVQMSNSVTKASGDSGIKNKYSLPSNQHFQQSPIWTSGATVSQKHQETQELRTNTHCPQINISNKVSFEHQVTLLEMLIWGQWVFALNSWVSWVFCDTVAPDVQMRVCWKCWFEGNEYLFLIPESPDAFVTLLLLMFK